jgi:hypothetical protein
MIRGALSLCVALATVWPGQAPARGPAPPGLSWADADSLSRKLRQIRSEARSRDGSRRGSRVEVTEAELNSYLNLTYASQMPEGVTDVAFGFDAGQLEARAMVDLERARGEAPALGSWSPMALLGGNLPVELKGSLTGDDGFATLQLESVTVGSLPVPLSVLAGVVASSTQTPRRPRGFDIFAPFRLPYAVKKVRLESGRAWLEF